MVTHLATILSFLIFLSSNCILSQSKCPNWCNQRGICTSPLVDGSGGFCVCDMGFAGEDCSQRYCPHAFDPLQLESNQNRRSIRLETGSLGGVMIGKIEFSFMESSIFMDADAYRVDNVGCSSVLSSLKSASKVICMRESVDETSHGGIYNITLLDYPSYPPYMNNILYHNGNPPKSLFDCETKKVDEEEAISPFCRITDVNVDNIPLFAECGNHGVCDRVYGKCSCELGFKGLACNDLRDNEDIVKYTHNGPFFTASILKVHADRDESTQFNLFQLKSRDRNLTTVRGDGLLHHEGDMMISMGVLRTVGWIEENTAMGDIPLIQRKSLKKIQADQSKTYQRLASNPPGFISNIMSEIYTDQIRSNEWSTDEESLHTQAFHVIALKDEEPIYSVNQDGDTYQNGSLQAANGSFTVGYSMISGDNLALKGNLEVMGSANVEELLTIGTGFALTPEGMTVDVATHTGTLFELTSRQAGFNGSMLEIRTEGEQDASMIKTVSGGLTTFELTSRGEVQMAGLQLSSGGIKVESGGIQIEAGGLSVHGGLTMVSGVLNIEQQTLRVGSVVLANKDMNIADPLLQAKVANGEYKGSVIDIDVKMNDIEESQNSPAAFNYLTFRRSLDLEYSSSVFEVYSDGSIDSQGGAIFRSTSSKDHSGGGLTVHGPSRLNGEVSLSHVSIDPVFVHQDLGEDPSPMNSPKVGSYKAEIPLTASYVSILPTGDEANRQGVEVLIQSPSIGSEVTSPTMTGRVLILTNLDIIVTRGVVHIPPGSTVMLVFDGKKWVDIQALKAPVNVLKNVKTFEADNDLAIGNHTFTARRLRSTQLPKDAIITTGLNGVLMANPNQLGFSNGVLTTSSIKFDNLLSSFDAKGAEISNSILSKVRINSGSIVANDITLNGENGLAFFNNKGQLHGSKAFQLDADGQLILTDLSGDLNFHGFQISNVNVMNCNLSQVHSASIDQLKLSSQPQAVGSFVVIDSNDGLLGNSHGILTMNRDLKSVKISALEEVTLLGSIQAGGHVISQATLQGGHIDGMTHIATEELRVTGLRTVATTPSIQVVFADQSGKLLTNPSFPNQTPRSYIHLPHVSVDSIQFTSETVDFDGKVLTNAFLDPNTVDLGSPENFTVGTLKITSLVSSSGTEVKIVAVDPEDGKVSTLDGIRVTKEEDSFSSVLTIEDELNVAANEVSVKKLSLPKIPGGSVLVINPTLDANGVDHTVMGTKELSVDSIEVESKLILSKTSQWIMNGFKNSLLAINDQGVVVPLHSDSIDQREISFDLHIRHLTTSQGIESNGKIQGQEGLFQSLYLSPPSDATQDTIHYQRIMTTSEKDGAVSPISKHSAYFSSSNGASSGVDSLHVAMIQPVGINSFVDIQQARLTHSNLSHGSLQNMKMIETASLVVNETVNFMCDVSVEGSILVHGTVVGSGPYMDSSDRRFKKDIQPIDDQTALKFVENIQGVTYSYRTDEFKSQNFPSEPQIGWIADEVQALNPELVTQDAQGYQYVSYSHSVVLIVEAMKDYMKQTNAELESLRNEIQSLRKLVHDCTVSK